MAAKTPTTVRNLGPMGDCRLIQAVFDDLDDGDTWASGLSNSGVVGFWINHNDNPTTQTSVGIAATYSSGTFTFYPAEDNAPGDLYILVRS